jgi:hypothetical protein
MEWPLLAQSGRSGPWNSPLYQLPERNKESPKNGGFYRAGARAVRIRKIDPALFGVGLRYQSALLYFVGDSVSVNFAGKPAHRAL